MSAIESIIRQLRDELAALEDATDRIRRALAVFEPERAPATLHVVGADGIESLHHCDQCDDAFSTKQGLSMHKTRRHKPAPATAPPPAVSADRLALRCDDCDETFPVGPVKPLVSHVLLEHARDIRPHERQPRAAES